ncbi:aminoacyl-tRNA deacylase [Corynebacterium hindlerae]|uniref:aminoacyl-tRNA deacylase n=1 Tax=Corynebacterium hindlerae TaxID=699041 RepID=UPI003AABED07
MLELTPYGAQTVDPSEHYPTSVCELLTRLNARVHLIDPNFSDTAEFAERYHVPLERCLNALLVETKIEGERQPRLVMVPAHNRIGNSALKKALGGKSSFMPADRALELTGMQQGAVTPIGLPPEIPIALDSQALTEDSYIIGGQDRSLKIEVPQESLQALADIDYQGLYS